MYTKRKDGRYQVNVYIGDGQYKTITSKSIKKLKLKEAELRKQVEQGMDILSQNDTLRQWADRTYEAKKYAMKEREYQTFVYRCEYFVEELGKYKITQVRQLHIQALVQSLYEENPAYTRHTSARTVQYYVNSFSQIFDLAIKNRVIVYNPCDDVYVPDDATTNERRAITPEERKWIQDTEHIMQTPCLIALYCGLRRGELTALQWSDVNFTDNTIRVNKSYNFKAGETKTPKTKSGNRIVPMPDIVAYHLKMQPKVSTYVCTNKQGKPMNESNWKNLFEDYLRTLDAKYGMKRIVPEGINAANELSIQRFTMHCLRHTYATILYSADVDVKTAQDLLGHANVTTTLKVYTHLEKTTKARSISKLNNFISGEINQTEAN